jgi:hypothetical protein
MATETPLSGENIFIRKPDLDFLLVVCLHILPKSYRFRVIRDKFDSAITEAPLAEKIFLFEARPRLPISGLLTLCVYLETFSSYSRFFTQYLQSHVT